MTCGPFHVTAATVRRPRGAVGGNDKMVCYDGNWCNHAGHPTRTIRRYRRVTAGPTHDPKTRLSDILVRVHASGINPTDWKNRAGKAFVRHLPLVLGWDVSGVVEAVGTGVTLYKPGDEVFGMLPYPHGVGAHAEYVVGPTRAFVPKPAAIAIHVPAG